MAKEGEVSHFASGPEQTVVPSQTRVYRQEPALTDRSRAAVNGADLQNRNDVYTMAILIFCREITVSQAILKWGNSLAFRIPSAIAKQMEIEEGAEVEFRIEGKQLIVEKADEMPRFTDRDLVRALRKANRELIDLGRPRGKEIL